MDITRIGYTAYQNTAVRPEKASEKKEPDTTGATTENQAAVQNRDTFVQTGAEKPVTYSRKLTDAQVQQLKDEQAQRMERFIQMLQSMVVKQGQRSNLTLFGMDLYVTPEQSRQAAESIAEGGEYSVDAVAGRIMDMAKALSGGDPSKIDTLRTAVQKGFQAAGVELGGELPSICGQTYDEVMKRFDEWEQEAQGTPAGAAE